VGSVFGERLHDTRLRREAQEPMKIEMSVGEVVVGGARHPQRKWLRAPIAQPLRGAAEVYAAVVSGTRDYLRKNGFAKAVLGLSGGVDSALTAAIAADALGPQNVIGVLMPSRHTSAENLEDAAACAEALGIQLLEIPIESAHKAFEAMFKESFRGTRAGISEENIQPRIRGNILMALSNKFGYLALSTGNKSELATGYCTLYGDMAGGFAVLKDIPKTLVYDLCRYRNSIDGTAIPERILTKEPSAELRDNQKDTDSLPPYEQLDPILRGYVEDDRSFEELVAAGHDPATVTRVIQLVDRSEYKRRQAPPGVKITTRAFGRDRRMPLTSRYAADGQAPRRATRRTSTRAR